MSEVKIELRGWMVIPGILLVLGLLAWRHHSLEVALESGIEDQIKFRLAGEYARGSLDELQTAHAAGNEERMTEIVGRSTWVDDIELTQRTAKGFGKKKALVRFRVKVAGNDPPIGPSVRYYEFEHRIGGWRIVRERSKLYWYFKLF